MSELKEELVRVLETIQESRDKRMSRGVIGCLNPDDFADAEQYKKAVGPPVAILESDGTATCPSCDGKGTEADYVGLEMRCVEVECSICGGKGAIPVGPPQEGVTHG